MGKIIDILTGRGWSEKAARIIAIAGLGLIILLILWGASCAVEWGQRRTAATQQCLDRGMVEAGADTAEETANTTSNIVAGDRVTDALVAEGQGAVRAAPEAERGDVTVAQLCRFKANANDPRCKGAK